MKNKLLILFCLVIGWASVLGQQIMHVPQSDKLPVQSVTRIFQDSEGYIWYGTGDGLCRDDGYNIRVFRTNMHNRTVMRSNVVDYITEDLQKRLWIGTGQGLYILDKSTYQLHTPFASLLDNQPINYVQSTSSGECLGQCS